MVTFIYEHFDEEISVTDIAKAAFVSERECFRLFKTLLNTTPLTYYHSFNGHIGTHFDVENGVFPIDYCRRNGWIFDVSSIPLAQEITSNDIDLSKVRPGMFIGFLVGTLNKSLTGAKRILLKHLIVMHRLR